jgi:hypothetical protein
MRSSAALSVVIVVFGAIATSPRQISEPIIAMLTPGGVGTPLMSGDERALGIPIIYVAVLLIFYRLLCGVLERTVEAYGRPRAIALAQATGVTAGLVSGVGYADSAMNYARSLRYLEGTADGVIPDPLIVVRDAVVRGSVIYLAATVTALGVAVTVVAARPRWLGLRPPPRPWRGVGLVELAGCSAVGVIQSLSAPQGSPLWSIGSGVVGAGLAMAINLARRAPAAAVDPPEEQPATRSTTRPPGPAAQPAARAATPPSARTAAERTAAERTAEPPAGPAEEPSADPTARPPEPASNPANPAKRPAEPSPSRVTTVTATTAPGRRASGRFRRST